MTYLTFQNHTLEIVQYKNKRWLKGRDITKALQLSKKGRAKLWQYHRHKELFTDGMTTTMPVKPDGPMIPDYIRLFSLRGALLIAALSHAQQAKAFRVYLLSVMAEPQWADAQQNTRKPFWQRVLGRV